MNPNVILCPIELSASGNAALLQAAALARWYDAELHVALVRGGRARRQPSGETSSTGLSSFMEAVDTDGLRLSSVVLTGDPVSAVTEHAKLIAADLVVVPRHGRRFGTYWRPGVYAKDLTRVLRCPTLAVPDAGPRDAKGAFVNILCPTDFSAASAAALRQALGSGAAERRHTDAAARPGRIPPRDALLGRGGVSVDRRVPRTGRQDFAEDAQCSASGRLQLGPHRHSRRFGCRTSHDCHEGVRTQY